MMEDNEILDLYFARSERAIAETDQKFGGYCFSIAYNILTSREDSEECVSDTYLAAWNAIPPRRLNVFLATLPEVERNVFLCRYWYLDSIQTVSERAGFSQSKVTSMLHRTRGKLRKKLSEEGYL